MGSELKLIWSTVVRAGKLAVVRVIRLRKSIRPVMVVRELDEILVISSTLTARRFPFKTWMPSREMSSLVSVAMAMSPVNVLQEASAVASPALAMVVVVALHPVRKVSILI